jgi:hypothetical protein
MRPRPDANPNGAMASEATPSMQLALRLLLEAHGDAHGLRRDVWEFALEFRTLTRAGVTSGDLRRLLCLGLVQHAVEHVEPTLAQRTFVPLHNLALPDDASFVLTPKGVAAAHLQGPDEGAEACIGIIPRWDGARRELHFRGVVVKRFRQPADCQEVILAAFEEEHWPPRIDNPLPPRREQDARQRLHDTLIRLNRNQCQPLLRFRGDGTGEGLFWEPAGATGAPPERLQGGTC